MNSRSFSSGFTLVELIVSMAITSVIALFVFGFATSLAQLWRNTESGVDSELDTQIALDQIVMDLESALFQERVDGEGDPVPMLAVSAIAKDSDDVYSASFSNRWEELDQSARPSSSHFESDSHQYGWAGSWVRFFTASPSVNAVGYQLIRRSAFADSSIPKYLLHRSLIRHDNSITQGFDITAVSYRDGNTAEALRSPRLDGVILEDVVDFGVRLYVFDEHSGGKDDSPNGLRLIFPADGNGDLIDSHLEHLATALSDESNGSRYPDVVEVFLRVLDDVGAGMLLRLEEGDTANLYEDIIAKHSRLYRRMVRLPGREPRGYEN